MSKKIIFTILIIGLLAIPCMGQEKVETKTVGEVKVKTWKMPNDLVEDLRTMIADFNKRFEEKLDIYKYGLKAKSPEFKDMPNDVVFDLQGGVFMRRDDYIRLQNEARAKLEEEIKNDKKEAKGDEKKTS